MSPSGLSDTTVDILLKQEDEKAKGYSLYLDDSSMPHRAVNLSVHRTYFLTCSLPKATPTPDS